MNDIFISYASADRPRIQPLLEALRQQHWSVWWDRTIPPGKTWDQVIEEALKDARCVIVLWSRDSVISDWVLIEANQAKRRAILVPALLDDVEIPLAFSRIQAANLVGWTGALPNAEIDALVGAVSGVLSNVAALALEATKRPATASGTTAAALEAQRRDRVEAFQKAGADPVAAEPNGSARPEREAPERTEKEPLRRGGAEAAKPATSAAPNHVPRIERMGRSRRTLVLVGAPVLAPVLACVAWYFAAGEKRIDQAGEKRIDKERSLLLEFDGRVSQMSARGDQIRELTKDEDKASTTLCIYHLAAGTGICDSTGTAKGRPLAAIVRELYSLGVKTDPKDVLTTLGKIETEQGEVLISANKRVYPDGLLEQRLDVLRAYSGKARNEIWR